MNREEEIVQALFALRKNGEPITAAAVREWITDMAERNFAQGLPDSWNVAFGKTIRTLVASGVLVRDAAGAPAWPAEPGPPAPPVTPPGRGNGADGGRPPDGRDGGNEGDPGGGFRAVLSHHYLFSLPQHEFEDLLDAI